jgi:hypothetical protein
MAESWTVKGRIVVDHLLPELVEAFGTREGVAGVTVKVSALSKIPGGWGWWNSWGKLTTDSDGQLRGLRDPRQRPPSVQGRDPVRFRPTADQGRAGRSGPTGCQRLPGRRHVGPHRQGLARGPQRRRRGSGRRPQPRQHSHHPDGRPQARGYLAALREGPGPVRGLRQRLRLPDEGHCEIPHGSRREPQLVILCQPAQRATSRRAFSTTFCPEVRLAYSLKDVPSVFLCYPAKGFEDYMRKDDLDFSHFLARAGAILPGFDQAKIKMVKTCLDPNSTVNPAPRLNALGRRSAASRNPCWTRSVPARSAGDVTGLTNRA